MHACLRNRIRVLSRINLKDYIYITECAAINPALAGSSSLYRVLTGSYILCTYNTGINIMCMCVVVV